MCVKKDYVQMVKNYDLMTNGYITLLSVRVWLFRYKLSLILLGLQRKA